MTLLPIIWQITDGKRGHENQSTGLVHAICNKWPCKVIKIHIADHPTNWLHALFGSLPATFDYPKPSLIIGAGSRTHRTVIAAGKKTKAPTVILMAPWKGIQNQFTFCVVPEHDERSGNNILETRGALNTVKPATNRPTVFNKGLILVGGPSNHHEWHQAKLIEQITAILKKCPDINWTLTTSRRTPVETSQALVKLAGGTLKVVPVEATTPDWLPDQFNHNEIVWVSEDSVSMIYESLSSGARVGLLPVPRKTKKSRVIRGVDQLIAKDYVALFSEATADLRTRASLAPLAEADRVAEIIINRLLR